VLRSPAGAKTQRNSDYSAPSRVRGIDGTLIDLGGRQQRLIVALLLLHANKGVSVETAIA
jgi:hypothetical protein